MPGTGVPTGVLLFPCGSGLLTAIGLAGDDGEKPIAPGDGAPTGLCSISAGMSPSAFIPAQPVARMQRSGIRDEVTPLPGLRYAPSRLHY